MFLSVMKQKEEADEDTDEPETIEHPAAGSQQHRMAFSSLRTVQKNRAPVERVADAVIGGAGRVVLSGDAAARPPSNVYTAKVNVYQVSSNS